MLRGLTERDGDRDISLTPTLDQPTQTRGRHYLHSRPITKSDFDAIVQVVDRWWDGPIALLAHPMFFYEFGKYARVVDDTRTGRFVGFLLGFIVPAAGSSPATGYIHLVGIDPEYRRKGVARALYSDFANMCLEAGCRNLKATTTVANEGSIRFHNALGWECKEEADYAGPGRRRLVLTRAL